MAGYYNQPSETAAAFTNDGFERTRDIAVMQKNGYSRVLDREKDVTLVRGFKVFQNELENVTSFCPGIVECAAVGVLDEIQADAIKFYMVRNDVTLNDEKLTGYCNEGVKGYTRIRSLELYEALPNTNVPEILQSYLRASSNL